MFEGVYTALITPFKNNRIDWDSLERIIEMQINGGIDGIVPLGTTGECPTLSFEEHEEFIQMVVKLVHGRSKVIAGTGANCTAEAVRLSKSAEAAGVDGVLQVSPYYNKPPQRGLIAHFESVAKAISVPVILYNIPSRTGVNFLPESIAELLERTDNIAAVKEASGDLSQMMRLIELCGDRLSVLSGDDGLFLPLLTAGGKGLVSVLSNILPEHVRRVYTVFMQGQISEAQKLFTMLLPICRALFLETNPIPIKTAMALAGYCTDEMRLPLVPMLPEKTAELEKAFAEGGVKLR